MTQSDTYTDLLALLEQHGARYDLLDHPPEGATEIVSNLRGHPTAHAAKCILLMLKIDRKTRRYVLAVVPGDRRVDLDAVKQLFGARYAGFCDAATATNLARTKPGTVLPFVMHEDVELVVDIDVFAAPQLYFNAAQLDRSIRLATEDYRVLIGDARIERIAEAR